MGFLDDLSRQAKNYRSDYEDSRSYHEERYSRMSNDQLKREINHLVDGSGMSANRMGKMAAMRDEIDRRRG